MGPLSKYDFQTLKLAKIRIFSKSVTGPWDDPRQHLSIGKVFKMLLFDVGNGFWLLFVHLKVLFIGQVFFVRHMHGFLRFSGNLGFSQIPSEASGVTPVNICWLGKCPICFPLMLGRVLRWFLFIWDNFYLANKKSKGRTLAFCHFRTGLVRRNVGGGWNRTKVAWKLDPNSFSNKVTQCLGLNNPFEFEGWNIFP